MSDKGNLFLIPNTMGTEYQDDIVPFGIGERIKHIKTFFIENPKIARKLLIGLGLKGKLDSMELISMKKGLLKEDIEYAVELLNKSEDIGILSDAGCPAIADPGSVLVQMAHKNEARVIPLSGPSSILLALMASGFNGQNFSFHGYLPKEPIKRKKAIRSLEKDVYQKSQTQLFIETPYRNKYLFDDLLSECQKNTKICLALDLTFPSEQIEVHTVEAWRKKTIDLNKKQCLFLIYK